MVDIASDRPEFISRPLRSWLTRLGIDPLYIEPGSPWEHGSCESFNGMIRNQLLNGEVFYTLKEAQVIIKRWRIYYTQSAPAVVSGVSHPPRSPRACELRTHMVGGTKTRRWSVVSPRSWGGGKLPPPIYCCGLIPCSGAKELQMNSASSVSAAVSFLARISIVRMETGYSTLPTNPGGFPIRR